MKKLLLFTIVLGAHVASAQTPSGLLTGPVAYTSPLNNAPYGWPNNTVTFANGSTCSTAPQTLTCPYLVKYVVGTEYKALKASDGTGNCYTWNVWQLLTGSCQTSFHGGGMGEYGALYCGNSVSSDINGVYSLSCTATWDGTAITVIGGADIPIQTQYTINVTIQHHPVQVWIPAWFRTPRHLETWQAVDSMVVMVTPKTTGS